MHNNIMAAGSRDRPPMIATGRYAHWRSRFLTYIDTRPIGDALLECILEGPYTPSTVIISHVPATKNNPAVPEITTAEIILNMSPENKAHFESEKEAIHLLLTRIGDEIYLTIDACKTAHEIIAKNANPLAVVVVALPYPDTYYQAPKSNKPYAPTSKQASSTRSNASTKFKGKEITKPITPPSESASEHAQKNLALIAKYFKKLYKPTKNNLNTSSNSRNKNVDTTPRNLVILLRNAGSQKRVKDSTYHKEKILLCKQAKKGVQLQAEQSDWLADTDEEIDEHELEAHYNYMERSRSNTCVVEKVDSNVIPDSPDLCDNDIHTDQNAVECDDEHVALTNLIANLKLDVDEKKKDSKAIKESKHITCS
nr:hypothetical protein [Tanacetum cinerariifolium]